MADPNSATVAKITVDSLSAEITQSTTVHFNVGQEALIITEDKIRLCLNRHMKTMEAKNGWIAPLGILIAVITTLVTTEFKPFVFESGTWKAIFVISGFISFGWLIKTLFAAWRAPTIDDIVAEMKRSGAIHSPASPKE